MKLLAVLLMSVYISLAKPEISVQEPWVREVPPVSTMSAAFMKVTNTGDEDDYLVGASSDIAQVVEIHTTVMEGGLMKMRKLEKVKIPAGETVEFRPMGKHIMLIDLKKPLKRGDRVNITLIFEKSGKISVTAPVKGMKMHMRH